MQSLVAKIPASTELSEAFSFIFKTWTSQSLEYGGLPMSHDQDMGVEWSVSIPGRVNGLLTIRGNEEFMAELSKLLLGQDCTPEDGIDAFKELVNQFTGYLISDILKTDYDFFDPFLPVPSSPSYWPARRPESACSLNYKGHVLEIRLWLDHQDKKAA